MVIDTPEAAKAALDAVRETRLKAAEVLRKAAPSDPLPYLLQRTALWEDITEAPAATDGATQIAGGDAAFAARANELQEKGDWAALLSESEEKLPANPVWFDLDLWVYRALEGLGKPYAAAKKAVGEETASLLRRVPGLLELKFADGTPFASQSVKLWLQQELASGPAGGKASAPAAADSPEAVMAEARGLVARKDFPAAAQRVLKEVQKATRGRDRFVWRLNLAKLCLEAGKPEQALPQLQSLDDEGRKFGLEDLGFGGPGGRVLRPVVPSGPGGGAGGGRRPLGEC
jgi:type VI secretion system protein VasJ